MAIISFLLLFSETPFFYLLLSRFLARASAHLFSESRNSIRTPNLTRCGTCNGDDLVVDDDDDDVR